MSPKLRFLAKFMLPFLIFLELESVGFKYLTMDNLNHQLSSIFSILINPFLGWSNFLVTLYNCFQLRDSTLKY